MTTSNATGNAVAGQRTRSLPVVPMIVAAVSVVCLLISLLGATWLHIPANPAAKTPAASVSRSDLSSEFSKISTTWVQGNYFSWQLWVLTALVLVVAIAAFVTRSRGAALLLSLVGLVGLVLTTFALKGDLTWSQYWAGRSNLRIGGYLAFLGFLLALVVGLLPSRNRT